MEFEVSVRALPAGINDEDAAVVPSVDDVAGVSQDLIIILIIIIIILYYKLAEHINRYMTVVQYIVITVSTRVQLLTSQ